MMRINLTGQLSVEDGVRVLDESALPGRQGRLVLACLALDRGPVHRDVLAASLWPDGPPATWERTLSGIVSRLRLVFAAAGFDALTIVNAFGCYELQRPSDARLDIEIAGAEVEIAERSVAVGDLVAAKAAANVASSIARRQFITGEEGEWIDATRTELRALLVRSLEASAVASLGSSDAIAAATEVLEVEPFRESAHVLLMRAHAALGNPPDALLAYERCRQLLADELGVDPSSETQAFHVALLRSDEEAMFDTLAAQGLLTLPHTLTTFVGRVQSLETVLRLPSRERLVSLTGPGGVGKTRLAVEAARSVIGSYPDGVHVVDLTAVSGASPIAAYVAMTLGLNLQSDATPEALASILGSQRILLVMDNCEHVLESCAAFVRPLLDCTDGVSVLATSREPLALGDESVLDVPPLDVPDDSDGFERITPIESVALFCSRVSSVRPDFELTAANASAVAEICRRLDGIPLAIELAASRVGTMSVTELSERLAERVGPATQVGNVPRHRTLQAAIDWSYDLLGRSEADAFRRLAVFEGSFSIEDAGAVSARVVDDDVAALVARSLLVREASADRGRYRFLETIKEYARERARSSDAWLEATERHLDRFVALVPTLEVSNDQAGFLRAVQTIRADARAALDRALNADRILDAIAIAGSIWRFWLARGSQEGRSELERTLRAAREAGVGDAIAPVLVGLCTIVFNQSDLAYSRVLLDEAIDIAERQDDLAATAVLLANAASLAHATGDVEEAEGLARRAIAAADASGAHAAAGQAFIQLVWPAVGRGDARQAAEYAQCALDRFVQAGYQSGVARSLLLLAGIDDPPREDWRDLLDRALEITRQIDDKLTEGIVLAQLGATLAERSHLGEALVHLRSALHLNRRIGNRRTVISCVEQIACVIADIGDPAAAVRLFASATTQRDVLGLAQSYTDPERIARLLADAELRTGDGGRRAWASGSASSLEEAYALAMTAETSTARIDTAVIG